MLCVWKMQRVQCVIEHDVKRHLPYVVCGWKIEGMVQCTLIQHGTKRHHSYVKMDGVVHDTLIKHGVERHLPFVVCAESGGCGA